MLTDGPIARKRVFTLFLLSKILLRDLRTSRYEINAPIPTPNLLRVDTLMRFSGIGHVHIGWLYI